MSEARKTGKKIKWDKKKILTAAVIVLLAVLLLSGKLSLQELLGIQNAVSQESTADSGEIQIPAEKPSESAKETGAAQASTGAETKAAQAETKATQKETEKATSAYVTYKFRSKSLLNQHYDKHGRDMGFASAEAYQKAASDVINNPAALHKTEKEDGDFVYYVEATNEFAVLSTDGYIRTYFLPDAGKKYYDRQ